MQLHVIVFRFVVAFAAWLREVNSYYNVSEFVLRIELSAKYG